jgi:predicted dehydrogenase
VKTGFNHRFHRAVRKAKELCEQNSIGEIFHIRSRYGHGGRPGMETEWRCDKDISGGGELLDQGVHIIDLCRWFIGDQVKQVYGKIFTSFWDIAVDDNAFFNLEFSNSVYAQCHVSWTNWKNVFSFEIFGSNGYIHIQGLGGSYGLETLEIGYRNKNGGKPDIKEYSYPDEDDSWLMEWQNFKKGIETGSYIIGDALDGHYANIIIDAIYRSNEKNEPVRIN